MVLGASNYTYAAATRTRRVADFTSSIARGLEFFGGVPEVLAPDYVARHIIRLLWPAPLRCLWARLWRNALASGAFSI